MLYYIKRVKSNIKKIKANLKKMKLINKDFSIISQNCIGAKVYQDFNLPYKSPTVGLFFESKDFIKFLEKLEYYLNLNLYFPEENSSYPVGYLDDIKIHFLHYKNKEEAIEKWSRRIKRINYDNLFFIYTDRDGFKEEYLKRYEQLKFKNKIFISSKPLKYSNVVYIEEYQNRPCVENPYKDKYLKKYFNFIKWFNDNIEDKINV